jgi:rhodanese-related sulfurtransferase
MLTNDIEVTGASKIIEESNTFLMDVRGPSEYAGGHAIGAVNIPLPELERRIIEIPADRPVLVICQSGGRSAKAVAILGSRGFANAVNVLGGTSAWLRAGLPTETSSPTGS